MLSKKIQIFIMIIGITSLIFITMGKNGEIKLAPIGYILAYAVCAWIMLDLVNQKYQIMKYGA